MTERIPSSRKTAVCLLSLAFALAVLPLGCRGSSPEATAAQEGRRVIATYLRAYRDLDARALHNIFTAARTQDEAALNAAIRSRQASEGRIQDWWYKEARTDPSGNQFLAQVTVATTKQIALITFDVRKIDGDWVIYYLNVDDTLTFDKLAPDIQRALFLSALKSKFVHPNLTP